MHIQLFLHTLAVLSALRIASQFSVSSCHCLEINNQIGFKCSNFFPFVQIVHILLNNVSTYLIFDYGTNQLFSNS